MLFHICKDTKSLVDSLRELLLFLSEHFKDEILSLLKLRITVLALIDDNLRDFAKEGSLYAKCTSMHSGTSDDTAKHIAPALVRWHNSVRNKECRRTDMVCDKTDRNIVHLIDMIFLA